jgi:hypothetical protein
VPVRGNAIDANAPFIAFMSTQMICCAPPLLRLPVRPCFFSVLCVDPYKRHHARIGKASSGKAAGTQAGRHAGTQARG